MPEPLRIGICSTYAPRACGLATFAADLENSLHLSANVDDVSIIAMVDSDQAIDGPLSPVIAEIAEADAHSYAVAARRANDLCDVVIVQHEFGIFGGTDGELVLEFLRALTLPSILTLHTVLSTFSPRQVSSLRSASAMADAVTVFTPTALDLLVRQRIVDEAKIHIVPHGAPSALFCAKPVEARGRLDLTDRFVVSTFGLVSPGKGLELAIEAMREVADVVPSAVLVIAGRTHPGESRRNGEHYRSSLIAQVDRLDLGEHVRFIDSFLPVDAVADVLASTDVFVTPYINAEQIVSGALTFAVAAGCPVVSSDYLYARDLLSSGSGTVVEGRRPAAFARAILAYATDDAFRAAARSEASRIGAGMHWAAVGQQVADLADVLRTRSTTEAPFHVVGIERARSALVGRRSVTRKPLVSLPAFGPSMGWGHRHERVAASLPRPSVPLVHLRRLIDGTGIVQHATGIVPLLSSGYCVDDVARLIPIGERFEADSYWDRVTARAVAFVANAFDPDGIGLALRPGDRMHNFMAFDRSWSDRPHFGDHVGRAAVGLASVVHDERYAPVCEPILRAVFRDVPSGRAIHPVAYTLLAQSVAPWLTTRDVMAERVAVLMDRLQTNSHDSWFWFEDSVRYDAGMLPEALLAGGVALDDDHAVEVALRALRWLDAQCDRDDHVRFPGHLGMRRGQTTARTGDEQPLEARALVCAHARAWEVTGDGWFRDRAALTHTWFHGRNRLGVAVADDDGGCFDGLSPHGVNRNQGAESTLAYVTSALTVDRIHLAGAATALIAEVAELSADRSDRPSVVH